MEITPQVVEEYKRKGVDISWALGGQSSPMHIRERYEDVGFDPDTGQVTIGGAMFPSGQVPGTELEEGRHFIHEPETLAEAIEAQIGEQLPITLTPHEQQEQTEMARAQAADQGWMTRGAQRLYRGVMGGRAPLTLPYEAGMPTAATTASEREAALFAEGLDRMGERREDTAELISGLSGLTQGAANQVPSSATATPWSEVRGQIPRGSTVTVLDPASGRTFQVKRYGGSNHMDSEPLTKKDTEIIRNLWGFRWSRRPIMVNVDGKWVAASMHSKPHGGSSIKGNDYPGHFCIHFKNSRNHIRNAVDSAHQAAIAKAARGG